jgi:hypothetical protein
VADIEAWLLCFVFVENEVPDDEDTVQTIFMSIIGLHTAQEG